MGAQGDMDLVVHVKPFGVVVQFLGLQGHSCHEAKSPIEIFEMELLEDGVSAFQLIPPHSPQVWQQLVPLLGTQPVRFAGQLLGLLIYSISLGSPSHRAHAKWK